MVRVGIGVGIVVALLLAGVTVIAVRGTAVAGTAVAASDVGSPIAGTPTSVPAATSVAESTPDDPAAATPNEPPQVGDCLLEEPYGPEIRGLFQEGDALPSLRLEPCTGARHGEVVSVGPGTVRGASYRNGDWGRCIEASHDYLGLSDAVSIWSDRMPATNGWPALLGPDANQRAAGQDWSACVMSPPPSGGGTGANYTVDHSLRDAWNRPADQALFALCMNDENLQIPVGCLATHRFEEVSYWPGDPDRPADDNLAACRAAAAEALGSQTHLDSGALTVLVVNSHVDEQTGEIVTGSAAVAAEGGYVVDCMVAPADTAGQLTGPLRGLGDQPVPLR